MVGLPQQRYRVPAARDLVARGADVEAMTTERIYHSIFPDTADADFQVPETLMTWAVNPNRPETVRVLLETDASAYYDNDYKSLGPLNWAAHLHRANCLRLIIDASEDQYEKDAFAKGQIVDKRKAV